MTAAHCACYRYDEITQAKRAADLQRHAKASQKKQKAKK